MTQEFLQCCNPCTYNDLSGDLSQTKREKSRYQTKRTIKNNNTPKTNTQKSKNQGIN